MLVCHVIQYPVYLPDGAEMGFSYAMELLLLSGMSNQMHSTKDI